MLRVNRTMFNPPVSTLKYCTGKQTITLPVQFWLLTRCEPSNGALIILSVQLCTVIYQCWFTILELSTWIWPTKPPFYHEVVNRLIAKLRISSTIKFLTIDQTCHQQVIWFCLCNRTMFIHNSRALNTIILYIINSQSTEFCFLLTVCCILLFILLSKTPLVLALTFSYLF